MTEKRQQWTPGPWRIVSDAQGPCMVMHPTLDGVAIANLGSAFIPLHGFYDPTVPKPESCPEGYGGTTYHPERVANARLIAAAPEMYRALRELAIETKSLADRFVRCCVASGSDPEFADIAPSNARKLIAQAEAALRAAEGGQP